MSESDYKRGQKHGNESRFAEPVGFLDLLGGKDYVAGKQNSYDRRVAEAGGHFLGGSTERKDWNSSGTSSDSNNSTSHSDSSYSSSSSASGISGGYSGSSSSTSSSGFGTFVFVAVCIAIVIGIIISFTNNSNMQSQQIQTKLEHEQTAIEQNNKQEYQPSIPLKNGTYPQGGKSFSVNYTPDVFRIFIGIIEVQDEKIIVHMILKNVTDFDKNFLISNGNTRYRTRLYGIEYHTPQHFQAPYIEDQFGCKYDAINPPLRGEVENNHIPDDGTDALGGDLLEKYLIPSRGSLEAEMEFPRPNNMTRMISLILPSVNGWQAEYRIHNLQLTTNR